MRPTHLQHHLLCTSDEPIVFAEPESHPLIVSGGNVVVDDNNLKTIAIDT
jgi:hypothetical protein